MPAAKPELGALAAELTPAHRPGDHAQAMMDLGATICTPRSPACGICPLMSFCRARALGVAALLPQRQPKVAKPVRHGIAWVGRREDGLWLLERRPDRGLLGGMLGWPGSEWDAAPREDPPAAADWRRIGDVRHTFTHFQLVLEVQAARLPLDSGPTRGRFRDRKLVAILMAGLVRQHTKGSHGKENRFQRPCFRLGKGQVED